MIRSDASANKLAIRSGIIRPPQLGIGNAAGAASRPNPGPRSPFLAERGNPPFHSSPSASVGSERRPFWCASVPYRLAWRNPILRRVVAFDSAPTAVKRFRPALPGARMDPFGLEVPRGPIDAPPFFCEFLGSSSPEGSALLAQTGQSRRAGERWRPCPTGPGWRVGASVALRVGRVFPLAGGCRALLFAVAHDRQHAHGDGGNGGIGRPISVARS
jgi:hypothetical protein